MEILLKTEQKPEEKEFQKKKEEKKNPTRKILYEWGFLGGTWIVLIILLVWGWWKSYDR
jgi:hypothetical protein